MARKKAKPYDTHELGRLRTYDMKGFMQKNELYIDDIRELTGASYNTVLAWINSKSRINIKHVESLSKYENYKEFLK